MELKIKNLDNTTQGVSVLYGTLVMGGGGTTTTCRTTRLPLAAGACTTAHQREPRVPGQKTKAQGTSSQGAEKMDGGSVTAQPSRPRHRRN